MPSFPLLLTSLLRRAILPALVLLPLASCTLRLPEPEGPVQRVPVSRAAARPVERVKIHIIATNIHTGVVFPYDWLIESGFHPPAGFGHPKFVTMSWGDRTAYVQQRWLTPWEVFDAFVIGTPSVMEIIPFDWNVTDVCLHQRIYEGTVRRDRGPYVAAFLNHCARTDAAGHPVIIGPSSWGDGKLIDCRYQYYFPRICNVWTSQVLQAAGLHISSSRAVMAGWLLSQAEAPENGFRRIWNGD